MARNYTQVLEDVVKNQSVQIAQLISANEVLKENLDDFITGRVNPSSSTTEPLTAIEEVEARIKAEAEA